MGNTKATTNLGYCYLYGKGIEVDLGLAIQYLQIAATHNNIEVMYKLGDIYGNDKWGVTDKELSIYYYRMAASSIVGNDWNKYSIFYNEELLNNSSLCLSSGREHGKGGSLVTNFTISYVFFLRQKKDMN